MLDFSKHSRIRRGPGDVVEFEELPLGSEKEMELSQTTSTHALTEARARHHGEQDCRHKLGHILERQAVHIAVIVLIVIDTLIVILELLIDIRVIKLCPDPPNTCVPPTLADHNGTAAAPHKEYTGTGPHNRTDSAAHATDYAGGTRNVSSTDVVTSLYTGLVTTGAPDHHVIDAGDHGTGGHEKCHHVLIEILHVISILILCIFVVEIALKIYVDRLKFFKNVLHMLDAVVVLVSLGLDIASLVHPSAFTDAGGLLILLRLWRITRIVNGIILSVEEEWELKVQKIKRDNLLVERERDHLLKETRLLQETLTNHGIAIPTVPQDPGDETTETCESEY